MKHGLVIDETGSLVDFAREAVRPYEYNMTAVGSFLEGVALLAEETFDLVMLSQVERCPGSFWQVLELVRQRVSRDTLLIVMAPGPDAAFYARAQQVGVTALSAPLAVPARAVEQEAAG
jgi:CheY-like chemotaxis protein